MNKGGQNTRPTSPRPPDPHSDGISNQSQAKAREAKMGLYNKYHISRTDGKPIPDDAQFFCIRYDQNTEWGRAARCALRALAADIAGVYELLAIDLLDAINSYDAYCRTVDEEVREDGEENC